MLNYWELYTKLQTLSVSYQAEIENFIDFLITKQTQANQPGKRPVFGSGKGLIEMSPDFDKPLEDFDDCQ
jgi:hypothetical protein